MPSAVVPTKNRQIKTVSGRKAKECVTKSNNAAEERLKMQNWINRFDQLFAALEKSESNQLSNGDQFSTTLEIKGYEPSDIKMVVDVDRKLYVKGNREVQEEDGEIYFEEFNDIILLPNYVDDEEINLIKERNGFLTITAPIMKPEESNKLAIMNQNTLSQRMEADL